MTFSDIAVDLNPAHNMLIISYYEVIPGRGLEPLILAEPDPKSGASANFATLAAKVRS